MTVAVGGPRLGTDVVVDAEALVFAGARRSFERISVPTVVLHHGEVLVAVELALICPADVHVLVHARPWPGPLVLGHEQVGRIIAIGPQRVPRAVDGHSLAVGDRVVWGVAVDCGRCSFCHSGESWRCRSLRLYGGTRVGRGWELSGSFATHVHLLPRTPIVRVGDGLAAELLAQAPCATATVVAQLERVADSHRLDDSVVLVHGAGLRALTATAMAREAGAAVIVLEPDRERRDQAIQFGADAVVDGRAALGALLGRMPGMRSRHPVALDLGGPPRYAPRHLTQAVEFLERAADRLPFAELVGEQFRLAEAERGFRHAGEHETARVGLRP